MVPLIEKAGLTPTWRGSKTERALSRTAPLHSIQLAEKRSGRWLLYPTYKYSTGLIHPVHYRLPAHDTKNLLQPPTFSETSAPTASPQRRSAAGIISRATPSQWENLLGDALSWHASRCLVPFCRQVYPVQAQTEEAEGEESRVLHLFCKLWLLHFNRALVMKFKHIQGFQKPSVWTQMWPSAAGCFSTDSGVFCLKKKKAA